MNRRTLIRIAGGAASMPILAGCTVLDALDESRTEIEITTTSTFEPGGVTIKAGESVVWRNNDIRRHRLSTDPEEFDEAAPVIVPEGAMGFTSGELLPNDRFSQAFNTPGDYIYACTIHPHMVGTITVQPAES